VAHVAHYQIRNRGTVGGSLAHADPAAELPGVAVTCEGELTLCGQAGSRRVRAGDFFTGPLSTVRQPDEIVTELHLAKWPSGRRWAFRKYARRNGDFALAGILLFCTPTPPTVAAWWQRSSSAVCGPRLSGGARDAGEFPGER
jgi:carbon-monoxide dehydrogenase medium subunit